MRVRLSCFKNIKSESGNVIIYIFAALGLFGFLAFIMTSGTKESVTAADIQKTTELIKSDLEIIHNAIQECALMYPDPVDVNGDGNIDASDNPSAPYPLYPPLPPISVMWWGSAAQPIKTIVCPGKYINDNTSKVFDGSRGKFFSILDRSEFTTTYLNDKPGGGGAVIRIRISRAPSTVWAEVISRVDAELDPNNAGIVDVNIPNGILDYYIIR